MTYDILFIIQLFRYLNVFISIFFFNLFIRGIELPIEILLTVVMNKKHFGKVLGLGDMTHMSHRST